MPYILSEVNTLTTVAIALVEENKRASKEELQELQQELLQEKLLKD